MSSDDFERQLQRLLENPRALAKLVGLVLVAIIIISAAISSWYQVDPQESAVVRRFGQHMATTGPGLHFKLPFGIDKVDKVETGVTWEAEFGFRRQAGTRVRQGGNQYDDESIMVTGDLAVADVEWVTQYRISDPYNYLFEIRSHEKTFRDLNESVMREVVGDRTVTEVITVGREEIQQTVKEKLQELSDEYNMGINITLVELQDVNPPAEVVDSFHEVNAAQQERERMINDARREKNKVIPKARGEAKQNIQEAQGYAAQRENRALGEAERFKAVFTEYSKFPEVTRTRVYLETMQEVLGTVGRKVIIDEKTSNLLPLLNVNPEG